MHRKGFTIIEMLLMVIIISVSLVAIIVALNNGMTFIQKTREKTIAINLAREGIEAVYQMRDTNWYRWAGQKESCRLKRNPLVDEGSVGCSGDNRMSTGNYILLTAMTGGQQYFYLSGPYITGLDLANGVDASDRTFSLCKGSNGIRSGCIGQDSTSNEGQYFRQIQGLGLFIKNTNTIGGQLTGCANGASTACSSNAAKEYRFCSKVGYIGKGKGEAELCGLLTNFQKK